MDKISKQIMQITFAQMPNSFTSREFAQELRKNNLDNSLIVQGYGAQYLHKHAVQDGSRRRWKKLGVDIDSIQEAIELLKSQGYKVMQPVTEYREL
jgi:hypothetical protein